MAITSSDIVTPPTGDAFQATWARFKEVNDQVRHFNTLQSHYRTMASTWLLAALGALGFFYSTDRALPVARDAAAVAIGLAAAIGICLLWVLDVLVYHELLVANDEVGRQLECENAWLPQIRHTYANFRSGGAPVRLHISLFYLGSSWLLVALASFAAGHLLWDRYSSTLGGWLIGGATMIIGTVGVRWMYRVADRRFKHKEKLRQRCSRCQPVSHGTNATS